MKTEMHMHYVKCMCNENRHYQMSTSVCSNSFHFNSDNKKKEIERKGEKNQCIIKYDF